MISSSLAGVAGRDMATTIAAPAAKDIVMSNCFTMSSQTQQERQFQTSSAYRRHIDRSSFGLGRRSGFDEKSLVTKGNTRTLDKTDRHC